MRVLDAWMGTFLQSRSTSAKHVLQMLGHFVGDLRKLYAPPRHLAPSQPRELPATGAGDAGVAGGDGVRRGFGDAHVRV